jgi:tetratricopeptide (TPR) repeat protein
MKKNKFLIILFFISSISLISNYRVYKVNINQQLVVDAIRYGDYKLVDEIYETLSFGYPTLTATTIPIKNVLAANQLANDSILKALDLLRKGNKDNPNHGYGFMILANIYDQLGIKDSFAFYTRKAVSKLPNAPAHYALMGKLYIQENKIDSLKYLFDDISSRVKDYQVWKIYLGAMLNKDEISDSLNVTNTAKLAKEYFDEKDINLIADYLIYGKDVIDSVINYRKQAIDLYDKSPALAIDKMIRVIELYDENIEDYEVLIKMLFFENNYSKVISLYNDLNKINMTSLKADIIEFISISYVNLGDFEKGCYLGNVLNNNNYKMNSNLALACGIVN